MPHILARGKARPTWHAVIYADGRPRWRALGIPVEAPGQSRRELRARALAAALDLERRLRARSDPASPPLTWLAAAQQYLEATRARDRHSEETRIARTKKLHCLLRHVDPDAVLPESADEARGILADYLAARAATRSATTVRTDQAALHHFCDWIRGRHRPSWSHNPAARRLHLLPSPVVREPATFTQAELAELWRALAVGPLAMIFRLMGQMGLRAGEARRAAWADVDPERRTLRVLGKGGRHRLVPIPADVWRALPAAGGLLSVNPATGGPWTAHALNWAWRRAVDAAGLPRHCRQKYRLRRTCISEALQRGLSPAIAARLFGHGIDVMMRHYARLETAAAGRFLEGQTYSTDISTASRPATAQAVTG